MAWRRVTAWGVLAALAVAPSWGALPARKPAVHRGPAAAASGPPASWFTVRPTDLQLSLDVGLNATDGPDESTRERTWGGGAELTWLRYDDARGTRLALGVGVSGHDDRWTTGADGTRIDTLDLDAVKLSILSAFGVPLEEYAKPSIGFGEQRNATQTWTAEEGHVVEDPFWTPTWTAGLSIPLKVPLASSASLELTYRGSLSAHESVSAFEVGLAVTVLESSTIAQDDGE